MFNGIWRDLLYAGRSLAKARAFTLVCVVSLGVGMVPVIAIPYWRAHTQDAASRREHGGLVELVTTPSGSRGAGENWSYPDFVDPARVRYRDGADRLDKRREQDCRRLDRRRADGVCGEMFVSANYFRTIGVALVRGAGFDATGDNPLTAEPVVILGYSYWQNQMGSDPDIIGKTLTLDGVPHVVVGVAPEHFSGHMGFQERQLFLPLGRYPPLRTDTNVRFDRGNEWLSHPRPSVARRRALRQASAAVAGVTSRLANEYPATNQLKAGIVVPYDPLGHFDRPIQGRRDPRVHPDRSGARGRVPEYLRHDAGSQRDA